MDDDDKEEDAATKTSSSVLSTSSLYSPAPQNQEPSLCHAFKVQNNVLGQSFRGTRFTSLTVENFGPLINITKKHWKTTEGIQKYITNEMILGFHRFRIWCGKIAYNLLRQRF